MSKNFASPQPSPREEMDINNGSTYALQVALRNLKERYHKLQRKLNYIEEDNLRLENGKTELIGEMGALHESSIKLREKNLQLNQEIHSKHQENCSLRERYSSLSHHNITLARDNRRLQAQVSQLLEASRATTQGRARQERGADAAGGEGDSAPQLEEPCRLSPDSITPVLSPGHNDSDHSEDSIDNSQSRTGYSGGSPRHHQHNSPTDSRSRLSATTPSAGDRNTVPADADDSDDESVSSGSSSGSSYSSLLAACEDASDRLDPIMDQIQRHNHALASLLPLLMVATNLGSGSSTSTLLSQRDRDLSTVTVPQPLGRHLQQEDEGCDVYNSRLATCGSVLANSSDRFTAARMHRHDSRAAGGGGPVTGTTPAEQARPTSPFDWRNVQIDDDDDDGSHSSSASSDLLPQSAVDSRSPHHQQQQEQVQPGYNNHILQQLQPAMVARQPGGYSPYAAPGPGICYECPPQRSAASRSRSNSVGSRGNRHSGTGSGYNGNVPMSKYGSQNVLNGAGPTLESNRIYPSGAVDDDSKICPMCNVVFTRDITQDMFENHVVAHFEDIDVSFEVV